LAELKNKVYIYNTMSREKEELVPRTPGKIGIYTCGPTVYNFAHLGNFRTFIFEDALVRMLRYNGFDVTHVMNITDVGHLTSDADEGEDRMIKAMRREGKTPWDIAEFYTEAFFRDSDRLNVKRPDVTPRATQHIQEMIDLIQCLFEKGHAYQISDGVYFDVATFPSYGELSRMSLDEQEAGARIEVNPEKHNPADFALWKLADTTHAMRWPSPWGEGYPGWHIECSAMSMKYLGQTFDIHCGGVDHIPVHHENEIAQSEGCTNEEFVRYWMHAEFLLTNATKMSKRAGAAGEQPRERDMGEGIAPLNTGGGGFLTVQTLIDQGIDPIVFRYFCFGAKYRAQLNYTDEAVASAGRALDGIYDFVTRALEETGDAGVEGSEDWQQPYQERFLAAINDDLNMPAAIAEVHEIIREANRREQPAAVLPTLFDWDKVLGLQLEERARERAEEQLPAEMQALIDERQAARKARDFARADALRRQLRDAGIEIEDTPQGVRWKRV
jgi:cysteinyl-tRNA synthetase